MKKYKVLLGTSLLILTNACQNPKKGNPEDILCYEMPADYEDTINIRSQDSLEIMCYEAPLDSVEIIEVVCYDVAAVGPEPLTQSNSSFLFTEENEMHKVDDEEYIFDIVEEMPEFPYGEGGEVVNYMRKEMVYPKKALKEGLYGRVTVSFVVEKDGSISGVEILRGIDQSLDKEALRIIRNMPKWKPGKRKGQVVRVKYTLPVSFKLPM